MSAMRFELHTTDQSARRGRLIFDRGQVETPAFMPVGTYGTVKGVAAEDLPVSYTHLTLPTTSRV